MLRIVANLSERVLDGSDDACVDLVVHRLRNPPGALAGDALTDDLLVALDGPRQQRDQLVEDLLMAVRDRQEGEPLSDYWRDAGIANLSVDGGADQMLHVLVA